MDKSRPNLGLVEKSGLVATKRDLLKCSEAQVFQLNSVRSNPPLCVFGSDVFRLHPL